jgi:beta-lactamase superfamily II metal-dependent hydrolase
LLLLGLLSLSFSINSSLGSSSGDNIVINEFEQNPEGTDYGNEWVELYNPTATSIDVSGWTVSTTAGDIVTRTISSGTTIQSNGYYLVTHSSQWLDNEGESIVLRNAGSSEIDRTPSSSDTYNDDRSWQRYPNGQDTDLGADWTFLSDTKAASNGGEPTPTPSPTPTPTPSASPSPTASPTPSPSHSPSPTPLPTEQETITVYFIDVGQGDSIFVDTSGLDVLIDGGTRTAGAAVMNFLQDLSITEIHLMVATHMDADHIGGLITVLNSTIQVDEVLINNQTGTTVTYNDFMVLANSHSVVAVQRGDIYILTPNVNLTVLNPVQPLEFDDQNLNSVALRLQIGESRFLLMGDAQVEAEGSILLSGLEVDGDVLKVGHHGSSTATSDAFLAAVSPSIAVISAGIDNPYGHPHQETVDKLFTNQIAVYGTYQSGTIAILANFTSVQVLNDPTPIPDFTDWSFLPFLISATLFMLALGKRMKKQRSTIYNPKN